MVNVINSPWTSKFDGLLRNCRSSIVICSPFIGLEPCQRIIEAIDESTRASITFRLLTNLSSDNMLSRATDVRGLVCLYESFNKIEIKFLPRLHAKLYIFDKQAIVTSANLSQGGLSRNLEYGLHVNEETIVDRIEADARSYHAIGTSVDLAQLKLFDEIVKELTSLRDQHETAARSELRVQFEEKIRDADKEVLRLRVTSMSAHAGFAQTILYVLSTNGPCSTTQMYDVVQSIHPDICDDSIKLVISGEEWSQAKWKHRVRHAQ